MAGYTKLFGSIVHSTIWREPTSTRIVWITMLALKDGKGDVHASVPGLADAARVTRAECEEALERLGAPDPDSSNKLEEGRRIIPIEGGWFVVSHQKYSRMLSIDERRERDAERKRVQRASASVRDVTDVAESLPSRSRSRSRSIPEPEREDPERAQALPHEVAEKRKLERTEPTPGTTPVFLHKFPKGWKPKPRHMDEAIALGLKPEDCIDRSKHSLLKTYTSPFTDPDDQFSRDLLWLRTDLETKKFQNSQRKAVNEHPGRNRSNDDDRPAPVFGRVCPR
jgi:hypothetical protein